MTAKLEAKPKEHKNDFINLLALISITSVLGIYLITTSVLIAQDGVFYIEQARNFQSNPIDITRGHLPGYPFLIFAAHKVITLFNNSSSIHTWIYSAQGTTLLCRVLSFVVLYFIGKILVGRRNSFLALLILIFLPYPAEFGIDVLRDWPHILFLAISFLFLLVGAKHNKWWMFTIVGLSAGFGQTIRPECGQAVIYGILWLLISLLSRKSTIEKRKIALLLLFLLVSFAIITVPYMKIRGRILPAQLEELITSNIPLTNKTPQISSTDSANLYTCEPLPGKVLEVGNELITNIMENLMYFFFPCLLIGLYYLFRQKSEEMGKFFISAFILFNVLLLILLFHSRGYMSRRHCLPLVVFTIFYVPSGLRVLSSWFAMKFSKVRSGNAQERLWFFVLLSVGILICFPKLFSPMRLEKEIFITSSQWIQENTHKNDVICDNDGRIGFYAGRKTVKFSDKYVPNNAKYLVNIFKKYEKMVQYNEKEKGRLSILTHWEGKKYIIAVYSLTNSFKEE
jgi:hypothetical protein